MNLQLPLPAAMGRCWRVLVTTGSPGIQFRFRRRVRARVLTPRWKRTVTTGTPGISDTSLRLSLATLENDNDSGSDCDDPDCDDPGCDDTCPNNTNETQDVGNDEDSPWWIYSPLWLPTSALL